MFNSNVTRMRNLIIIVVQTFLAGAITVVAASAPEKSSFADAGIFELNSGAVRLAPDGKSLLVDTTALGDGWKYLVRTRSGVLQQGKNYQVTFRYRVETPDDFFHILCRPLGVGTSDQDTLRTNAGYSTEFKTKQLKFNSGVSTLSPAFQIHVKGKMRGELTGFKLAETEPDRYVPVGGKNTTPWKGDFGKLPTGATEFEVELPKNNSSVTIKAADFGFNTDNPDNVSALNQALAHCKTIGAARLELPPGTYRMRSGEALRFDEMRDFTFDGGGATLVYSGTRQSCVELDRCERVVFRNVIFDWDWETDPLASIVRVGGVNPDSIDFEFVDYRRFPRRDLRIAIVTGYDPKTRSVGIENGFDQMFEFSAGRNRPKTEWLSDNVLRVWGPSGMFRKGQSFRMQHRYYDGRCIYMTGNRNLTLEDIDIHACSGAGLIVDGKQQYWQFRRVRVAPPKDAPLRVISSTADHYHIRRSCGFFKMENCEFAFGADDCMNAHDVSGMVCKSGPMTVTTRNFSLSMYASCHPGDVLELRNLDFSPSGFNAPLKEIRKVDEAKGVYELRFDQPVPDPSGEGFVLFNRAYGTRNLIVRNNSFHDNRARGLLILASDVTIENNRFVHNEMGAIKIETGYTRNLWSEGYGADNIVIRNNTFDTVNPRDEKNDGRARDIYIGVYLETDPSSEHTAYPILSNILFENNTFRDSFGLIAVISSAGNVVFRDNTFENPDPRKFALPYRAGFYVTHADNVKIVNNRWIASPYVQHPGVYADPGTVKGLITGGNRVTQAP